MTKTNPTTSISAFVASAAPKESQAPHQVRGDGEKYLNITHRLIASSHAAHDDVAGHGLARQTQFEWVGAVGVLDVLQHELADYPISAPREEAPARKLQENPNLVRQTPMEVNYSI